MTGCRHLDVPYFAQWASAEGVRAIVEDGADPCADPDWTSAGFETPDEYRFWSRRICGLACLQSALTYWGLDVPIRSVLLRSALKWGAYRLIGTDRVEGLTYAPFADWVASEFGLTGVVHGHLPLDQVPCRVDVDSFLLASVSSEIRYPDRPNERRGGHLVLVLGHDDTGVYIHNPSGVPPHQADAHLDWATFARFYAGRGVELRRPGPGPRAPVGIVSRAVDEGENGGHEPGAGRRPDALRKS